MADKWQDKIAKVEKVEKVDSSDKAQLSSGITEAEPLENSKFHQTLAKADPVDLGHPKIDLEAIDAPDTKPNPITGLNQAEGKIEKVKPATLEQVTQQAQDIKGKLQEPISKLQQAPAGATVTPAQEAILQDKLVHIDSSLRTTLSKAGVEVTGQEVQPVGKKPLVKFLNYLTSADHQLNNLVTQLNNVTDKDKRLTPDKLMALQIKLSFIQNELEFFTNVLNKAMESTKTIMNVQV